MLNTRAKLLLGCAAIASGLVLTPDASAQARRGQSNLRGATGADCASPIILPAFPAGAPHIEAGSTVGAGDDYDDTCLDDYDGGEDLIYEFEVTETTCLRFTLDAATIWAGFAIATECTGFDSCIAVADSSDDPDILQLVLDPGTYYIMVDTFPPPDNTSFDLTIEECPFGACCLPDETCIEVQEWECIELFGLYQGDNTTCDGVFCPPTLEGDNCFFPLEVPLLPENLPYENTNTTAGRGNNYINTCLGSWDGGEDMIYAITLDADACLQFTVIGESGFVGMALHDACPVDAVSCLASSFSFSPTESFQAELTAGTYFLMVDHFDPAPDLDFVLMIEECPPFGACCLNDGTCMELSDFDCAVMDGEFQGDGSTCGTVTCPDPLFGACCLPDDTCAEMFENECDDLTGMFEGDGTVCIDLTCPVPPVNDDCADAIAIADGPHAFSTLDATTDGPAHADCLESTDDLVNQDIWFVYTAACTGDLTVSTCADADFDTKLAVYATTSCDPAELEDALLGCVDDPGTIECGLRAELTVPVDFGQTYLIRVGGFDVLTGEGTLVVACDGVIPCPGDANADLTVGLADLLSVLSNWGTTGPDGDVDADGMVGLADLLTVLSNWGTDCS